MGPRRHDELRRLREVVRRHYGLDRLPSEEQARAEVADLERRGRDGRLADHELRLYVELGL